MNFFSESLWYTFQTVTTIGFGDFIAATSGNDYCIDEPDYDVSNQSNAIFWVNNKHYKSRVQGCRKQPGGSRKIMLSHESRTVVLLTVQQCYCRVVNRHPCISETHRSISELIYAFQVSKMIFLLIALSFAAAAWLLKYDTLVEQRFAKINDRGQLSEAGQAIAFEDAEMIAPKTPKT